MTPSQIIGILLAAFGSLFICWVFLSDLSLGTKSVLFGAHCFLLHPFFVAYAWCKLYGFPYDPRLWVAFIVHDLGYIGLPNMDGPEGELHPYLGANIMRIFGKKWYDFVLYHSRFLAKKNGQQFSKLCVADKLAFNYTPRWLYLPMVNMTGEIKEYMSMQKANTGDAVDFGLNLSTKSQKEWYGNVRKYMAGWVEEHKDMRADTWTPVERKAVDDSGTY